MVAKQNIKVIYHEKVTLQATTIKRGRNKCNNNNFRFNCSKLTLIHMYLCASHNPIHFLNELSHSPKNNL